MIRSCRVFVAWVDSGIPLHRNPRLIHKIVRQDRSEFEDRVVVTDAADAGVVVVTNPVIRAAIDTAEVGDRLGVVRIEVAHRERILAVDYVVSIAQVLMLRKSGGVGQNDFCAYV